MINVSVEFTRNVKELMKNMFICIIRLKANYMACLLYSWRHVSGYDGVINCNYVWIHEV